MIAELRDEREMLDHVLASLETPITLFQWLHLGVSAVTMMLIPWLCWMALLSAWSRRWILLDLWLSVSDYSLLDGSYRAEAVGKLHVEATVEGTTDDHGHEHEHEAHDIIVVSQRWALVTGAGRGTGRALVRALSDQGFSLVCVDFESNESGELESTRLEAERRLERGYRGGVWPRTQEAPTAVKVGIDEGGDVQTAVKRCEELVAALPPGSLRLLVHSMGVSAAVTTTLSRHTADDVERLVKWNALLGMQLTRALWEPLVLHPERRSGILFASSAAAQPAMVRSLADLRLDVQPELLDALKLQDLVARPHESAVVAATTGGAVERFARALRAEAAGQSLALDVLAVTPSRFLAADASQWARASLLLLSTARSATMTPFLTDAIGEALVGCLPEGRSTSQRPDAPAAKGRAKP